LKYGARLINSFLGDNSTISCCEVLNSLIFPAHEQHHNNSFLCAALIMGQSNMAAGATVGSNHNSRAADGEIVAGRGFWPGLCVSLKHNSRFASYTLIAKGDFMYELNIRLPFAMVSNDVANDRLVVLPAYWFLYNMYALMRNNTKFLNRDRRSLKNQYFEYAVLAPDTVNEMFAALHEIEIAVGRAFAPDSANTEECAFRGREILADDNIDLHAREITLEDVENSKRRVVLIKVREGYRIYKRMITYYGATQLKQYFENHTFAQFSEEYPAEKLSYQRELFEDVGGQLFRKQDLDTLLNDIRVGKVNDWGAVHHCYHRLSNEYPTHKLAHALASLLEIKGMQRGELTREYIQKIVDESIQTKQWICEEIHKTRAKDYQNRFRQMVYENEAERDAVVGSLADNTFIQQQQAEYEQYV